VDIYTVDDNNFNLTTFIDNYNNITFIKVDNHKCKLNGYLDSSTSFTINKLISGWDKALYYFAIEEKKYEYIWYMEDDVLFYNEDTIIKIDNQYMNDDLLSNSFEVNNDGNKKIWLWKKKSTKNECINAFE
jgi:hypothetical protein